MTEDKSLNLLLEFVCNPVMIKNLEIRKYNNDNFLEYFVDPFLAGCMSDLGRIAEEALDYLNGQGLPAVRLATANLHGTNSIN
ncbi:MAG: hypothetical protein BWY99_01412 [Synergistetes bacterium ADurb.BinA166]|jgi:hypothetical protein|nr:MAG: hypothetical protein BWY99_01412 [Synergistetes bacterium ADurb.BinA166]